jgi:peptide deformylase
MDVVLYPDPILKKRASPLAELDAEVHERIAEMFELMYRERGVGLAAPQVGWGARVFVMNPEGAEQRDAERVFINPRILSTEGSIIDEEGCLSIPEIRGRVERFARVTVSALGLDGRPFEAELSDLPARVVQHEYDHLDGILFISHLSEADQLRIRRALKKLEQDYKKRSVGRSAR